MDIIALTETSLKNNENFKSNIDIEGYETYCTPSYSSKGGTAIYVNKKFNNIERKDLKALNEDYESVWVEIKNKFSKNVTGCIYRHPRYNFKEIMCYLENCLTKLTKENKEIYLCGDFNIDLLKIDNNQNYQQFYNMLCSFGFLHKIIQPTRVTDHHSTLIDNIFSNNLSDATKSGNIFLTLSKHFSQFVSIKREKIDYKNLNIFHRDNSKFQSQQFRDVSIQNWNSNRSKVNELFIDFHSKLEGCVDRHAPIKKLSPKEIKLKNKPWISTEISKLIKVRNKIFARKKRQPNNTNNKRLHNRFMNRVNREIKKSKKKCYSEFFEINKMNIKKIWSGIREIINIWNNISPKITQLNINGKIINNPNDVANQLNNFFVKLGPLTESSIPRSENISPLKFLKQRNQLDFLLTHVSHEVLEIITGLGNKSTGPTSIPVKLLKLIPDLIIVPLCKLINLSFISGSFPDPLRIVKVIPIHKNGSTQDRNTYRPISLLWIFDKIMEKIMHKRLYKFLEDNNILYNKQFGFRKNNATMDALIKITEKIKEFIDKGKYGCGIFIDLRKAFDTVNHDILLLKMEHYGVRGSTLQWFKFYLYERKQYVYINGECSELKQISCGVPQGSVLGPLLFLIYINDLPTISNKLDLYLFADDIYYEVESPGNLEKKVNKELKNLHLWLSVNRLALNIEKTNFVIFHPFNKPLKYNVTIKIHKKAITEKQSIKYLGILIDSTLSWKDHITNLSKKLSRSIGILYKLRPFVNLKIMKNVYHALFYSHLVYSIHV